MSRISAAPETTVPRGESVKNSCFEIQFWPTEKLCQREGAPRRFNRRDIAKSEAIIRKFGVRLPLVVRKDGVVLSHYVVVTAARSLGYDELPVVIADDLSETECDQLSLGLTRLYELGQFDSQLLGDMMIEIETSIPDVNFDDLGFDAAEVDRAIGSIHRVDDTEEDLPSLEKRAVSEAGDIWVCGPHRIGCGDAADAEWLAQLCSEPASMVSADPPYGCRVGGFVTTRDHPEFAQASGEMSAEELQVAFFKWCAAMQANARPGCIINIYIDWRSCQAMMAAAGAVFGPLVNMVVWVKDRAGMGSFYRSQHELVLIYRVPGGALRNNVELGRHGRNRTNVWRYPSAMGFARTGTEGDLLADHPTPKNKEMIADAMLDATKRGEVVLDPFLGSGSTLIAAEKVGRVCVGSDISPLYVDLAIRRWQAWTGKAAIHAVTGITFNAAVHATAQATEAGRE